MADGLLGKCKDCAKQDVKKHRELNIDYYRNYDVARYYAEGHRGVPSKEASAAGRKRWNDKNKEKKRAHLKVKRAIDTGVLVRKRCEKCGAIKTEAHHDDYSKPLDVRWLCAACHAKHHRRRTVKKMDPPSGSGGWGRVSTMSSVCGKRKKK